MSWNYRVWSESKAGYTEFSVRETYYNDDGEIYGVSADKETDWNESLTNLRSQLARKLEALDGVIEHEFEVMSLDTFVFAPL